VFDRLALLGALALRDVDDGPDQPGDLAVSAGERGFIVERVADAAVAHGHLQLVAARARIAPQLLVHRAVLRRDFRRLRKQFLDGFADEGLAPDSEVGLPGLVGSQMSPVPRLEEDGNGQDLDQVLRNAQRFRPFIPLPGRATRGHERAGDLCEKLLAPAPVFRRLDAVALADGGLGLALKPFEYDLGLRRGIPLPNRHEFPPSLQCESFWVRFFARQVSTNDCWM